MAASDARPSPLKNVAYRVTFPILDSTGSLVTGAASLDSEVSKDGGTFVDCTNEATEIATSSGVYFLDLTATEMNADTVAIIVKTATAGAKTTTIVLYPDANDNGTSINSILEDTGTTIPALIAALNDLSAAQVNAEVDQAIIDYDGPTNAEMEARTLLAANYASTAAIRTELSTELARIDVATSTRASQASVDTVDTVVDNLTTVVDNLNSGIITGAAVTGTLSTTRATTNITGFADNQLIGRVIIWLSGVAEGEASNITDYASLNGLLTFDALTVAPGNGDLFKIV